MWANMQIRYGVPPSSLIVGPPRIACPFGVFTSGLILATLFDQATVVQISSEQAGLQIPRRLGSAS